jgi:hypothetical protein
MAASLLSPVLGEATPEAWTPARLAAAKDAEQALLRGSICIPLVFFHDLWQTSADVLDLQVGAAATGLGLSGAHLDPHAP